VLAVGRETGDVPASLNEIYKLVGELTGAVKAIESGIADIKQDIAASEMTSSSSRAGIHRRLDEQLMRLTNVEADIGNLKNKVTDMENVTVEVKTIRAKAQGAGTLGFWLVKVGIGVVGLAGWLVGLYTWLTGRPPP
jgi:hypothetical protein